MRLYSVLTRVCVSVANALVTRSRQESTVSVTLVNASHKVKQRNAEVNRILNQNFNATLL